MKQSREAQFPVDHASYSSKRRRVSPTSEAVRSFDRTQNTGQKVISDLNRGDCFNSFEEVARLVEILHPSSAGEHSTDQTRLAALLREDGVVVKLLMILDQTDGTVAELAEQILQVLLYLIDLRQADYVKSNGLAIILKCLLREGGANSCVRVKAAKCLTNLEENDANVRQTIMSNEGVVHRYLFICLTDMEQIVPIEERISAASLVATLCDDSKKAFDEFVGPLSHWIMNHYKIALYDANEAVLLRHVVKALSRLHDDNVENIDRFVRRGLANAFVFLLRIIYDWQGDKAQSDIHSEVQVLIYRCLGNFASGTDSHRATLLEAGSLEVVCRCLDMPRASIVKIESLRFVANMAEGDPDQMAHLVDRLVNLWMPSKSRPLHWTARSEALRALTNMCRYGSTSLVRKLVIEKEMLYHWETYLGGYGKRTDLVKHILLALDKTFLLGSYDKQVKRRLLEEEGVLTSRLEGIPDNLRLDREIETILVHFQRSEQTFDDEAENEPPSLILSSGSTDHGHLPVKELFASPQPFSLTPLSSRNS